MAFSTQDAFTKCTPSIRPDINRCGGMTICDASIIPPQDLDAIFKDDDKWRLMDATLRTEMVLQACGAKLPAFVDFLSKNRVPTDRGYKPEEMDDGTYRIK